MLAWTTEVQREENAKILFVLEEVKKKDITEATPAPIATSTKNSEATTTIPLIEVAQSSPATKGVVTPVVLTLADVGKHATKSDCWIIIQKKVYDVSPFLSTHPGGVSSITTYCGKDATSAYGTKDFKTPKSHSAYATNLLPKYYVGTIGSVAISVKQNTSTKTPSPKAPVVIATTTATQTVFVPAKNSLEVVATHNTRSNCWMAINGKIYDLTNFITEHPGGQTSILEQCGRDGSGAFLSRGGTGSHSSFAYSMLPQYYIAELNFASQVQTVVPPVTPVVPPPVTPLVTPIPSATT